MSAVHAEPLPGPTPVRAPLRARPEPGPPPYGLRLVPAPPGAPAYDDELPAAPLLHLVRPAPSRPRAVPALLASDREEAGGRTPTAQLGEPRTFAHALVLRLLEAMAGVRPVRQLQRDTTPELYEQVEQVLLRRARAHTGPATPPVVRSVHVQSRPDGVAEVCATVLRGRRAGALALRLEGRSGRWTCTELVGL